MKNGHNAGHRQPHGQTSTVALPRKLRDHGQGADRPMRTSANLKRVKPPEGRTFHLDVGTVVIHEGGRTGSLFLNDRDGDFALFRKEPKEKDGEGATGRPVLRHQDY